MSNLTTIHVEIFDDPSSPDPDWKPIRFSIPNVYVHSVEHLKHIDDAAKALCHTISEGPAEIRFVVQP